MEFAKNRCVGTKTDTHTQSQGYTCSLLALSSSLLTSNRSSMSISTSGISSSWNTETLLVIKLLKQIHVKKTVHTSKTNPNHTLPLIFTSSISPLYSKHCFHISALQAPNSLNAYLPIRSRHHMEMSLCFAALPGLGRLVARWLEAVFCSTPHQRSCVPLVHFISPQGLCKRGTQGGSTLSSQLPHDGSSKLSLLGIRAKPCASAASSSKWWPLTAAQ